LWELGDIALTELSFGGQGPPPIVIMNLGDCGWFFLEGLGLKKRSFCLNLPDSARGRIELDLDSVEC
jgi:hypothetical protein